MSLCFFAALPLAWGVAREHIAEKHWKDRRKSEQLIITDLRWLEDAIRWRHPIRGQIRDTMPSLRELAELWHCSTTTVRGWRDNRARWADPQYADDPIPWNRAQGGRSRSEPPAQVEPHTAEHTENTAQTQQNTPNAVLIGVNDNEKHTRNTLQTQPKHASRARVPRASTNHNSQLTSLRRDPSSPTSVVDGSIADDCPPVVGQEEAPSPQEKEAPDGDLESIPIEEAGLGWIGGVLVEAGIRTLDELACFTRDTLIAIVPRLASRKILNSIEAVFRLWSRRLGRELWWAESDDISEELQHPEELNPIEAGWQAALKTERGVSWFRRVSTKAAAQMAELLAQQRARGNTDAQLQRAWTRVFREYLRRHRQGLEFPKDEVTPRISQALAALSEERIQAALYWVLLAEIYDDNEADRLMEKQRCAI
ncbi:MAG: hypothetical protein AAFV53_38930 [Myxococcota bacterium]